MKTKHDWFCIVVFSVLLIIGSCKNDIRMVNQICISDTSPAESGINVEVIYSTDGNIDMMVKSPVLNRYYDAKEPYTESPEGVKVYFYDSIMHVKSSLTSNYAIHYENKKMMEAKNDVVVVNEAGELLNTEHLIWDEKQGKIYSNEFVKITTADKILYGEGFESDETFNNWIIRKVKGTINMKEEKETSRSNDE